MGLESTSPQPPATLRGCAKFWLKREWRSGFTPDHGVGMRAVELAQFALQQGYPGPLELEVGGRPFLGNCPDRFLQVILRPQLG